MRHALGLGLLLVLAAGIGCNNSGSEEDGDTSATAQTSPGGVAIVDLDEVAKRLGRDVIMVQAIQQKQAEINHHIVTFQQQLQQAYADRRQELATTPAQTLEEERAQQQVLDALEADLNQRLTAERQAAQTELALYRKRLVGTYREEARPICRDIAAERGLSVVLTKDESRMLVYADAVDITDAVTEQLAKFDPPALPSSEGTTPSTAGMIQQAGHTEELR